MSTEQQVRQRIRKCWGRIDEKHFQILMKHLLEGRVLVIRRIEKQVVIGIAEATDKATILC